MDSIETTLLSHHFKEEEEEEDTNTSFTNNSNDCLKHTITILNTSSSTTATTITSPSFDTDSHQNDSSANNTENKQTKQTLPSREMTDENVWSAYGNIDVVADKKGRKIKKFWLVSTIVLKNRDEISGNANVLIYTKWYWLSKKKIDNFDAEFDFSKSENFPINPEHPFLNTAEDPKSLEGIDKYECTPIVLKKSTLEPANDRIAENEKETFYQMFVQRVYRATILTRPVMSDYPYDLQVLPIVLGTRKWKNSGTKYGWELSKTVPIWFKPKYPEDKNIVTQKNQWDFDEKDEVFSQPPYVTKTKDGKIALCLRLERNPGNAYRTIFFPSFVVVLVSMLPFFSKDDNIDERLSAVSTAVLSLSACIMAASSLLPSGVNLSYAMQYILICVLFELVLGLKIIMTNSLAKHSGPTFYQSSEIAANNFDHMSSKLLFQLWLLMNSPIVVHALFPKRMSWFTKFLRHGSIKDKLPGEKYLPNA